jgi:YVTN family beta-propeller protein
MRTKVIAFSAALAIALFGQMAMGRPASADTTTRSSSIALNKAGSLLFSVNPDANSVTVFEVGKNGGNLTKADEVTVGREPVCVAVAGQKAYVTNSASGTVSVVTRTAKGFRAIKEIAVGNEPRGCAVSEKGNQLVVTNHTDGTVSLIDTGSDAVVGAPIEVGGNPFAVAIDGTRVFVTLFYARLIEGGPGEGFDDGKEAVVKTFTLSNPGSVQEITLSPLASSGFTADRSNFCSNTRVAGPPVNQTFCPNVNGTPGDQTITQDPQGVFPNQLGSALVCGGKLYLPNIGAQPEPPVFFNVNIQALVHVVDTATLSERENLHVNLNAQIATEPNPANPTASLGRLFGNDLVAIASDPQCQSFFLVSRGGNYVIRAGLVNGKFDIGAPNNVVRFQTGNIPTGIAVRGQRAYVNNQVGLSVSVLDLAGNTVVEQDVAASTPPAPGSHADSILKGELAFFTALGIPDNGLSGLGIRDIVPLQFRGKQSSDAWSTCGSCHPFGLSDRVTWIFGDGPRNTIAMDALYSKINGAHDIRINNWSAARDSGTDFNNNSRNVQCGKGFAGGDPPLNAAGNGACPFAGAAPPNPAVFDHGISNGGSEALDVQTTWLQQIRPLNMPKVDQAAIDAGAVVFGTNCASCHGGAKWTKSQVFYLNNPAFVAGVARDPGLVIAAAQIISYTDAKVDPGTLFFLDPVGTFSAANPVEIRGQGNPGGPPFGVLGFNTPTMLGVNYSPPYFHNGAAQTLEEVFQIHLVAGQTIANLLGDADEANLLAFLRSIDGRTNIFESQGDRFKNPFKNM